MQGRDFLQAVALICLLHYGEGFWLWNKPTKSPPPSQNEIKTPVIIGNYVFFAIVSRKLLCPFHKIHLKPLKIEKSSVG